MRPFIKRKTGTTIKASRGQGMTEYIIIVALIAIAAVTVVGVFGGSVKAQFASLSAELIGEDGSAAISTQAAATAAEVSKDQSSTTLGNYTN